MGKTSIEWTDASWNPVTGCIEISPGCANCYAARLAATRLKNTSAYKGLAVMARAQVGDDGKIILRSDKSLPRWTGEVRLHPDRLEEPLHWKKPRRIFVCDMADLFHESVPLEFIDKIFNVMHRANWHTYQVLTKRAELMRCYVAGRAPGIHQAMPHVWLGVSVENQHFADERIPLLLATPAAVRFLSVEPLLGPVDFWNLWKAMPGSEIEKLWVIVGGESGPGARPMHPEWTRSLRDQCRAAGVPFFFKQWGEWIHAASYGQLRSDMICREVKGEFWRVGKKAAGRLLDGREWSEFPDAQL